MRIFWGVKNGNIIILKIRLFLKSLFHRISINMGSFGAPNQDSEEKVWFLLIERFVCNFENSIILKIDHWFRKSSKTLFYRDNMFNEVTKHIKPYPVRLIIYIYQLTARTWLASSHWLWLTFNTEKSVIMYTSGFFAQIQNCDKMSLVKRIWLVIICRLKHQLMKQIFYKIYWNPTNLTREAAGDSNALI